MDSAEYRQAAFEAMSEREWQKAIIDEAQRNGFLVAHFRAAQNGKGDWRTPVGADGKGFPDLVLSRNGHVIFAEVKTEKGRLRREQQVWLDSLRPATQYATHEVYVFRPHDWDQIVDLFAPSSPPMEEGET